MANSLTQKLKSACAPITDYVNGLGARDRKALFALLIAFGLVVIYYGVYQPLKSSQADAISFHQQQKELVLWLEQVAPVFAKQNGMGKPASATTDQSLLALVNNIAKTNELTIKRMQPEGDDKIRIWLENVSFNATMIALETFEKDNGLIISELTVERSDDKPGIATIRFTLER